jgi:hypothetical protein
VGAFLPLGDIKGVEIVPDRVAVGKVVGDEFPCFDFGVTEDGGDESWCVFAVEGAGTTPAGVDALELRVVPAAGGRGNEGPAWLQ